MHVIIWKFTCAENGEAEFEKAYGPKGIWSVFFRKGEGYLGTELLGESQRTGQFITIDRWISKEAYDTFRSANLAEYKALDERMEPLIEFESHVGSYTNVE